jgi:hypothetical protein
MDKTLPEHKRQVGPSFLRRRFRRLLHDPNTREEREHLRRTLDHFKQEGWNVYLFGGLLRDIATQGPFALPRDLDLVVDDSSIESIKKTFADRIERENRFGGLSLRFDDWCVDVWPVKETWAFQRHWSCEPTPAELPKTTFLNVEAVVMGLSPTPGRGRPVHDNGFFNAINRRVLDINFEENPYPDSCIVRTFLTAARLRYKLGFQLTSYIHHHMGRYTVDHLLDVQYDHYGRYYLDRERLERWVGEIHEHVASEKQTPLRLGGTETYVQGDMLANRQLNLWGASLNDAVINVPTKPRHDRRPDDWTY